MSNHRTDLTSLMVLACAYGVYGWVVANTPMSLGEALGLIVGFYIAFTVVMIVAHVAMALLFFWAPERKDAEREKDIHRHAARNGYAAIFGVAWAVPFLLALPEGETWTAHAVVGLMGLGEIVRLASLVFYRGLGSGRNQRALAS